MSVPMVYCTIMNYDNAATSASCAGPGTDWSVEATIIMKSLSKLRLFLRHVPTVTDGRISFSVPASINLYDDVYI
eukprot:6208020-Pleurochrysis_carterae.AAC.4